MKNNLPIIDLFVSIQGEGKRAGHPSLFIRVSGCNLRCYFSGSICDTPYSSYNNEKSKFDIADVLSIIGDNPQVEDIVITGGEPLLYQAGVLELIHAIDDRLPNKHYITIETNGSIALEGEGCDLMSWVDLWSISPKLQNSIAPVGTKIEVLGKTVEFTEAVVNRLNEKRKNVDAISEIVVYGRDYQLKFVYSDDNTITYIDELLGEIRTVLYDEYKYVPDFNSHVMLMPEGITEEQLQSKRQSAVNECIKKGWMYTDRLHITIWGDKRGY